MRWNRKQEVEYQEQFTECITSEAELEEDYRKNDLRKIAYENETIKTEKEFKKFSFKEWRPGRKLLYTILLYATPKFVLFGEQRLGAIPEVAWFGFAIYVEGLVFKWKQKRKNNKE